MQKECIMKLHWQMAD